MKDKNYTIISTYAEKVVDKIQYSFMIKSQVYSSHCRPFQKSLSQDVFSDHPVKITPQELRYFSILLYYFSKYLS